MAVQIKDFVRNFPVCAQTNLNSQHSNALLQPIEVNEPFVFWAIDYIGPLPETARGNKQSLVVMDHFIRWCEVFPTQNQRASTVVDILCNRVLSRFGPPTIIHSGQGRIFESKLMQEVCSLMGIHKSRTNAYHPQCDGQVERQNRTLQEMLAARDAFTHGPTGPGPRGPLKFSDLGGPEQNFEKPVNYKSPYKLTLRPCP